jgi:prepilin-type N-terminal cleavage/methylation domain-containing protein
MNQKQNGFTLIEMLVVVAVIGILSSVLLTALGPARNKAKDSRIIQEVNQVRSLAETLYDGDYDALENLPSVNIVNETLRILSEDITLQGGELAIIKSSAPAVSYLAYSRLNEIVFEETVEREKYYCIDSSGRAGFTTTEPLNTTICPL